jgi:phosphoribosylaminoimidazole (AIR) synthetase
MFRTFNMGVGMVIVVAESDASAVEAAGVGAFRLGRVVAGQGVDFVA